MARTRLIKRYANRKLYDTEEKRYVTLDQVANLVRDGEEIKVVDNESGEDLTSVTLSQILVEQEKKGGGALPKGFLAELVKSSTSLFDYLRKVLASWLQAAHVSEELIEKNVDDLVKMGQLSIEEGIKLKRDFAERTREYVEKLDLKIEERLRDVLGRLNIPTKKDLELLRERLDSLTRRYETIFEELRGRELRPPSPAAQPPSEEKLPAAVSPAPSEIPGKA